MSVIKELSVSVLIATYVNTILKRKNQRKKTYHASGMTLVEGRWQSCGWTIEVNSFVEAAQIAEADETFRIHSLSDCVVY